MAVQKETDTPRLTSHSCPLPWPADPERPQAHVCLCGRRWIYEPAHWNPLYTLEELRLRQQGGEFDQGLLPTLRQQDS